MTITVSVSLEVFPVWYEGRDLIDYGVNLLNEKESDLFNRYFFERNTMKEIGVIYGVVPSRICQMVKKIRLKVRKRIGWQRD